MKAYREYTERQSISAETHEKLLELATEKKGLPMGRLALAACCAVVLAVGAVAFRGPVREIFTKNNTESSASYAEAAEAAPEISETETAEAEANNAPEGVEPAEGPAPQFIINYDHSEVGGAADIALPEGGYFVEFSKPESGDAANALKEQLEAMFPDYEVDVRAIYDGTGKLWTLYAYGNAERESFQLELSPDSLPPSCIVTPHDDPTVIDGAEVYGWSAKYDCNGDKIDECVCGSEFMAGAYGIRFENVGSPYRSDYGGEKDPEMGGTKELNARFVEMALKGGLDLAVDELMYNSDIPAWRNTKYTSYEDVRQETEFLPYLPVFEKEFDEFEGSFRYQEDREHSLGLRWSKGLDDVTVCIELPESAPNYAARPLLDVNIPESYDMRLYGTPWNDTVPEEYRDDLMNGMFRAGDMSLDVINARGWERDAGGIMYEFTVLYDDGATAQYSCSGVTPEEVWAMLEPTLKGDK